MRSSDVNRDCLNAYSSYNFHGYKICIFKILGMKTIFWGQGGLAMLNSSKKSMNVCSAATKEKKKYNVREKLIKICTHKK
jgi:hypothetical protein